jgi:hypothetical protein
MSKSTNEQGLRPQDERAGWLREMQSHFSRTGFYRPEDLNRVLGDPRQGVSMPVSNNQAAAATIHTK